MNKCRTCFFGGALLGYKGVFYNFKKIIKKDENDDIIEIDYTKNEKGCRKTKWNIKEKLCLTNNFSEYIKYNV